MWAHPQLDVVTSGYGVIHTDAEIRRHHDIEGVRAGWDELVGDTGARYAFTSTGSRFGYALQGAGWIVLDSAPEVALFQAPPDW